MHHDEEEGRPTSRQPHHKRRRGHFFSLCVCKRHHHHHHHHHHYTTTQTQDWSRPLLPELMGASGGAVVDGWDGSLETHAAAVHNRHRLSKQTRLFFAPPSFRPATGGGWVSQQEQALVANGSTAWVATRSIGAADGSL
jgi:hypothetical protein